MNYQWKWQKVDRPGIYKELPDAIDIRSQPHEREDFAILLEWLPCQLGLPGAITHRWRCYLGPIPDIAPPEPELRLPEGWRSQVMTVAGGRWQVFVFSGSQSIVTLYHPDKATAIRAAQAAVDVLNGGG